MEHNSIFLEIIAGSYKSVNFKVDGDRCSEKGHMESELKAYQAYFSLHLQSSALNFRK